MLGSAALKEVKNKMVVGGKIKWKDHSRLAVQVKPFVPENDDKNISFSNADAVDPLLDRLAALYEEGDPVPDDEENIVLDRDAWNRIVTVKDSPSTTWAMVPLRELLELYYASRDEYLIFEQLRDRMDQGETLTEEDNVGSVLFTSPPRKISGTISYNSWPSTKNNFRSL